ncbi:imidazoleglycerol-phosphate dehydratase HisB [Acidobacteria bacterium ACD]|nr:MAG: imidazoleglycerol-phosphate dehydratase HisB [Acidobacteriota bacterium]MDL1950921.1 imidazoleglycerol-phosphate dehydratase HisB [Acidobacteria bacterium ACD]
MRRAEVSRETKETKVSLALRVDGTGESRVTTPVGFLSHMLETVARHAGFDLEVAAEGDVHVDAHHTVEDVGLALGEALDRALGARVGIARFGHAYVPLDEALARAVVDLSGRPYVVFESPLDREMLLVTKDFPFALVEEFWKSVAFRGKLNLHVDLLRGRNGHHAAEAVFKAAARALRQAVVLAGGGVPSTKGSLVA